VPPRILLPADLARWRKSSNTAFFAFNSALAAGQNCMWSFLRSKRGTECFAVAVLGLDKMVPIARLFFISY
jgi:hypothetical protein